MTLRVSLVLGTWMFLARKEKKGNEWGSEGMNRAGHSPLACPALLHLLAAWPQGCLTSGSSFHQADLLQRCAGGTGAVCPASVPPSETRLLLLAPLPGSRPPWLQIQRPPFPEARASVCYPFWGFTTSVPLVCPTPLRTAPINCPYLPRWVCHVLSAHTGVPKF